VLRALWDWLLGRSDARGFDPASPEGRRLTAESVEDRETDEFVEGQLGGIDPNRLLPDERPPRED